MGREARINQRPPDLLQRIGEAVGHILDGAAVTLVVTRRELRGGPGPAKAAGIFATHAFTAWGAQVQDLPEEARNAVAQHHLEVSAKTLQGQLEALRERLKVEERLAAEAAAREVPAEPPDPAEGEEAAHE